MNRELLISYATAFVSFLMRQPEVKMNAIKAVYLFGSVARGDFDRESDVDVFIDTEKKNEAAVAATARKAMRNFARSDERRKFLMLGIENEIAVKCGDVREWELYSSIRSEALVLFSPSISPSFRKYFLVELKPVRTVAKRNKLVRKLAGRREKGRKETGFVARSGGVVIDSRHFLVPADVLHDVLTIFSKEKVLYQLKEVWM